MLPALFQKLWVPFTSKIFEEEYNSIQQDQFQYSFKVSLVNFLIINIFVVAYGAADGYPGVWPGPFALSLIIMLLWVFSNRFVKGLEVILIILSLFVCIVGFLFVTNYLLTKEYYPAFFLGYVFGTYEKTIILKVPKITYKLIFSVILFIVKLTMFPINHIQQIFWILLQMATMLMSLLADLLKENQDRKIFQHFCDCRESLVKFKNLMVSGLSTNLLIISPDLKQELFSNEYLHKTLSKRPNSGKTYILRLYEWFYSLKVDKRSLVEAGIDSFFPQNPSPTVLDILETSYHKRCFVERDKKLSFSAEYLDPVTHTLKIYEISITGIVWDAKESIAIILNDITAHAQNQNLKTADSNKDKMLAMVSHELRTPINGILGVVRILQSQTHDPQTLQYLSICKSSGELLYNLVNSILDLQHLRDNKFSLKMTRYDLHELIKGVYDMFKFQFEEKDLYLNLELDENVPKYIMTDHNRLRQILINLIGNALKFTFEGGVNIAVKIDTEFQDCIRFTVSDTGIGIKEEDKAKLFKMYGRLDQENSTTNTQGVGFGLEISSRLASLLSQSPKKAPIDFDSQVGKGSCFSFLVKDLSKSSPESSVVVGDETNCYESRDFEEDIGSISRRLSPYDIYYALNSDRQITSRHLRSRPRLQSSHLLLGSGSVTPLSFQRKRYSDDCDHIMASSRSRSRSSSFSFNGNTPTPPVAAEENKEKTENPATTDRALLASSTKKPLKMNEKSILIIDDNSFNLLVAKNLLEHLGYQVKTALNGKLGIDLVKSLAVENKKPFGAILMDIQMPVMDGYEATKLLKEMMAKNEIEEMPIIALSANDTEADQSRCREVGMYDHLSKPLKEEHLKKVLEGVFNRNYKRDISDILCQID